MTTFFVCFFLVFFLLLFFSHQHATNRPVRAFLEKQLDAMLLEGVHTRISQNSIALAIF